MGAIADDLVLEAVRRSATDPKRLALQIEVVARNELTTLFDARPLACWLHPRAGRVRSRRHWLVDVVVDTWSDVLRAASRDLGKSTGWEIRVGGERSTQAVDLKARIDELATTARDVHALPARWSPELDDLADELAGGGLCWVDTEALAPWLPTFSDQALRLATASSPVDAEIASVASTVTAIQQWLAETTGEHAAASDLVDPLTAAGFDGALPPIGNHAEAVLDRGFRAASLEAAIARRDELLSSERWYTSAEVASLAIGAPYTSNPSQYASRLRRERLLIGVRFRNEYLHPAFQFGTDGRPMAAVRSLLGILPVTDAGWRAALWCFEPNRKLGDRRPSDVFSTDPEAVVKIAEMEFGGDRGAW
ncbi:MAG TPA: hypothetical protein VJ724_08685 [Tahibacter sp.]|nr:hypothetical protein [Tahibacter sp.]